VPAQSHLPVEILDYIETHAPSEDGSFGISQRELAKALGYHPCSMSRPLGDLTGGGLIRARREPVRGGIRKQLVYSLTEQGKSSLHRQTRNIPLLSGGLPPPPNPFFGRKAELKELSRFGKDGGSVTFVTGGAGMGKTALLSRHVRRLREDRVPFWFTIRGGSSPRHLTLALAHALTAIGSQQLAYYSQLPRPPSGREVADIAQRALADRGLLCVLDDVHESNADMKKFLTDFTIAFGSRTQDLFFFLGQEEALFAPKSQLAHNLTVGGLDRTAAHELTDRRGGLSDRFEPVFQSTLGSPLLLQLAVTTPGVEATVNVLPAAVVRRLTKDEVGALLPIALANEPMPETLITAEGSVPAERIGQWVQAGILYRAGEGRVELIQVVRAALVARVSSREEREAHVALANFYGRSHRPESVRERFLHLVAAEEWKAADQLLVHHERKLLALGYSDTLRTALRHLTLAAPKGAPRIRALRSEAELLRLHSEYAEAILSLRRAIVESDHDPRIEAECLHQILELYVRLRQVDDATTAYQDALKCAPPTKRMSILALLGQARIAEASGNLPRAGELYQDSFRAAKRARVSDLALEGVASWSRLAMIGGDRAAAAKVVEEGLPEARASGRLDIVFNLLLVRARANQELGQVAEADAEMRSIRSEAESLGYLNQLTYTLSGLAAVAQQAGNWSDSTAYARQASALAERLGNEVVLGHTLAVTANGELRQGHLAEALSHAERSVAILARLPPTDSLAMAEGFLAEIYVELGRVDEARRSYEDSIQHAEAMGMTYWRDLLLKEFQGKLDSPLRAPKQAEGAGVVATASAGNGEGSPSR